MSADNWTNCPKCKAKQIAQDEDRRKAVEASYGKIPAADYRAALDEIKKCVAPEETLREDYEIGIKQDGGFFCNYGCSCRVCGFEFNFRKEITSEELLKASKHLTH